MLCGDSLFASGLSGPEKRSLGLVINIAIARWLLRRIRKVRIEKSFAISFNNFQLFFEVRKLSVLLFESFKCIRSHLSCQLNTLWWISFVDCFIAAISIHIHRSLSLVLALSFRWLTLSRIRNIFFFVFY